MNIKPKDVRVTLPIVLTFGTADEIPAFAAAVNTIIHGKVKVKCEELGLVDAKHVGLFYLQRNDEYQALRDSWMNLIEAEEINATPSLFPTTKQFNNDLFSHLETPLEEQKSRKEIEKIREAGIVINDNGEYCRRVPECGCGMCR